MSKKLFLFVCALALAGCSLETESPENGSGVEANPSETIGKTTQRAIGDACDDDADCTTGATPVANSVCGTGGQCECPPCTILNGTGTSCDPVTDGTPCGGGGDLCTATCSAGSCTGAAVDCSGNDDFCGTYSCDASSGSCLFDAAQNTGTGCDPNAGDATVGCAGTCQPDGSCGGTSKDDECDDEDDFCGDHVCNGATGACELDAASNTGTGCDPNGGDAVVGCDGTCQADGSCGGASKDDECDDEDDFCGSYACDDATGACGLDTATNTGTGCDPNGGDAVVGCDGTCQSDGSCGGTSKDDECDGEDDFCGNWSCDDGTGACELTTALQTGTGCDPNGGDAVVGCAGTCQANGSCGGTSMTSACNADDDFCEASECNPATGACDVTATNTGLGCEQNGGNPTSGCSHTCQANGNCSGSSKTAECDAADTLCLNSQCVSGTGQCGNTPRNTGVGCTPGQINPSCFSGICQANGTCSVTQTMNAFCGDQATGNPCTRNFCGAAGTCVETALVGQLCNDGETCTSNEECNANGNCVGGVANDDACDAGAPVCSVPSCRLATDSLSADCIYDPITVSGVVCAAETECRQPATCNGSSVNCPAQANKSNSTPCGAPASCNTTTGVITNRPSCNNGTCPTATTTPCAPFNCNPTGPACRTSCSNDTECVGTAFCNIPSGSPTGVCETKRTNGNACTAANQCVTGICATLDGGPGPTEGVCCNAACNGQCESCGVPGSVGTCTAVSGGQQPLGQRTACSTHATCGGSCQSGNRASCTYPNGTECVAASCTIDGEGTHVYQQQRTCAGGSCVNETTPPVECPGSVCDLASAPPGCLGGCVNDTQCADGFYCPEPGNPCAELKDQGDACARDGECSSNRCVDGFCCDGACNGQCEACNVAGSEGTCSPATAGTQPVGTRVDCGGSGACQGSCDGTNRFACEFPTQTTSCGTASCSGTEASPAGVCDGAGSCAEATPVDCAPGTCTDGSCDGDCSACTADQYCVANRCVDKLTPGAVCVAGSDCESGFCVDGVCCDGACGGQCEACNVAGSEGACTAVPSGEAPRGARTACATDGDADCAGTCDGTTRTTCAYPDETTECRAASCDGPNSLATLAGFCQGNGACSTAQTQICPAGCSGAICGGGCTVDGDCASTEYCSAGVCTTRLTDGTSCATDAQCENGHCVDGVCCDTACTGDCEECTTGTCSNRTGAPLPGRTPCSGTGACGGTCSGTSASCSFPGTGVTCGEAGCVGGYAVGTSTCDGSGACAPAAGSVCPDGLLCSGGVCATSCTSDANCASDLVCDDGACVEPPEPPATGGTGPGGASGTGGAGTTGGATGSGGDPMGQGGEGDDDGIAGIDEGTCGCKAAGAATHPSGALIVLAGLALTGLRLRRRRAAA